MAQKGKGLPLILLVGGHHRYKVPIATIGQLARLSSLTPPTPRELAGRRKQYPCQLLCLEEDTSCRSSALAGLAYLPLSEVYQESAAWPESAPAEHGDLDATISVTPSQTLLCRHRERSFLPSVLVSMSDNIRSVRSSTSFTCWECLTCSSFI